ncbi:VPLPA-CTERM sorting domain-containing protein [Paracoccus caeni]|uniref:VPLPA-CTERM sorting domain-containing protein n=2 Tax=Paracoccus caeni TaxID=657651 RepID=A0A934SIX8_9RHOB|nr:VPLPA-CTERM sorting domain-containing protein [Paracoccus caeni]
MNGGLYLFPLNAEGTELELFDDEGNRLCCRNALTNLALDTTTGKLTGRINGVRNRENDHLFTLGETTDEGTELLVSDYLAGMLTYAYSANNAQYFPLFDQWPNKDAGIPNLAGQSIGWVNYDVVTDVLPAPVPVPAALPLLIGGIGALGYVGKRRRRKAA